MELMKKLKRHDYQVSPGLVYPALHSLERHGYLKREKRIVEGRVRKYYTATESGAEMLEEARQKIRELVEEVMQ